MTTASLTLTHLRLPHLAISSSFVRFGVSALLCYAALAAAVTIASQQSTSHRLVPQTIITKSVPSAA